MKYVYLVVSLLLTVCVFSMSFASGSDSASLSTGITNYIYDGWTNLFPNHQVSFDTMHLVVRKMAHIFEYSLIAISWFLTMRFWNSSLVRIWGIGLLISGTDELIQLIAVDRGPSIWDALLFDFLPFALVTYLLWIIYQKAKEVDMDSSTALMRLQNNAISPEKAYKELYNTSKKKRIPFLRRAHFIKLKIHVPGEKGVNTLLRVLFFLPLPILFLRILMSFVKMDRFDDDIPLDKKEIIHLVSHRGIRVNINTKSGEKVVIKTL